jgi:general secretion pathway protein G
MVNKNNLASELGFTLIELLVVLAILALLITISVPRYFQSIDTAKETILIENLRITRETIDKFYGDKGRYPDSLNELVQERYLRNIPIDPISDSPWTIIAPDQNSKGNVYSIKSSSPGTLKDGRVISTL